MSVFTRVSPFLVLLTMLFGALQVPLLMKYAIEPEPTAPAKDS